MAFVTLDINGNITCIFGCRQNQPTPLGYAEIADDDPRLAAFTAAQFAVAKPKPTPLDWFMRLSQTTQAALDTAARTDTAVSLALRYASGVTAVDVTDPRTIANVNLLKSKSLLTDAEVAALLAP